jgi:hypothetical protein
MAQYAVGSFEPDKSGSPYSFVCKNVEPRGPYVMLDTNRLRINSPQGGPHLFELEDWHSVDQKKQFATRIVASLADIRNELHVALRSAIWERDSFHPDRRCIVGRVLKTKYGYFRPWYDNGHRPNGQDESPVIWMTAYQAGQENPYGDALATPLAQSYLICLDEVELKRAHEVGIATASLGDTVQEKVVG